MTGKYRLYYNSDGSPKHYTMQELAGNYIFVDQQTFECSRYDIVVVDGKIRSLTENVIARYRHSEESTTAVCCDPHDITLIVDKNQQHIFWDYQLSL